MATEQAVRLHPEDNVAVALADLPAGGHISLPGQAVVTASAVPAKHKLALEAIPVGGVVKMYGVKVGKATQPIQLGEVLTTRNVHHEAAPFHEKTENFVWNPPDVSRWKERTFAGYHRADGQVGTRNYWLVVPLVFCENRNIGVLKQAFEQELGFAPPPVYRQQVADLARLYQSGQAGQIPAYEAAAKPKWPEGPRLFANVDGIKFLLHEGGCGGTREDSNNLCALIAGYIHHPNVAGATVLSLGCQNAQVAVLRDEIRKRDPQFLKAALHLRTATQRRRIRDALRSHPENFSGTDRNRQVQARAGAIAKSFRGAQMWRLRRIFRYFRESIHRTGFRSGRRFGWQDSFE